jgi:hypothetical protein
LAAAGFAFRYPPKTISRDPRSIAQKRQDLSSEEKGSSSEKLQNIRVNFPERIDLTHLGVPLVQAGTSLRQPNRVLTSTESAERIKELAAGRNYAFMRTTGNYRNLNNRVCMHVQTRHRQKGGGRVVCFRADIGNRGVGWLNISSKQRQLRGGLEG